MSRKASHDDWKHYQRYFHGATVLGKKALADVLIAYTERKIHLTNTFRDELLVYYSLITSKNTKTPEGMYKSEFNAEERCKIENPCTDPTRFDVTLSIKLLGRLHRITGLAFHTESTWTMDDPPGSNTTVEYMIYQIKTYRNDACHNIRIMSQDEVKDKLLEMERLQIRLCEDVFNNLRAYPITIKNKTEAIKIEFAYLRTTVATLITPYLNKKGKVILFNMVTFDDPSKNRPGAEKDNIAIREVFETFGEKYDVQICDSYTTQQIKDFFIVLQNDPIMDKVDSLIIFISSHGKSKYVFCTRDGEMDLTILRSMLYETPEGCPKLKGKAKVLMGNYCQGSGYEAGGETPIAVEEFVSEDIGGSKEQIPVARNIKTFFSTSEGVRAWRRQQGGNVFLQTFCKVLKRNHWVELSQLIYVTNCEVEEELDFNSTFSEEGSRFNHFYF